MNEHGLVLFASATGLLAAYYIARQKARGERLVCPLEANCEVVVNSRYSRLFGVPLEYFGLLYYGFIFVAHSVFLFRPQWLVGSYLLCLRIASLAAFLFSLYLIWVQFARLKSWCFWCLVSSFSTLLIFLFSFFLH